MVTEIKQTWLVPMAVGVVIGLWEGYTTPPMPKK